MNLTEEIMRDILVADFSQDLFQNAFKLYFKELGIEVKNWDALFNEMTAEGGNKAYIRMDDENTIIGFIMFKIELLSNWFFEEKVGFIREFWIAEEKRNNGHGSHLLRIAEEYFKENGLYKSILTTNTAEHFYESHGYYKDKAYVAKNEDEVFVKFL